MLSGPWETTRPFCGTRREFIVFYRVPSTDSTVSFGLDSALNLADAPSPSSSVTTRSNLQGNQLILRQCRFGDWTDVERVPAGDVAWRTLVGKNLDLESVVDSLLFALNSHSASERLVLSYFLALANLLRL